VKNVALFHFDRREKSLYLRFFDFAAPACRQAGYAQNGKTPTTNNPQPTQRITKSTS